MFNGYGCPFDHIDKQFINSYYQKCKSVDNKHVYIPELSLLKIQALFVLLKHNKKKN